MGRPTKRTPERKAAILNSLRLGNTRRAAASFAEIDHATFYRWLEQDATFSDAVEKAEADAETRFLGNIAKAAADGTWTAAAWWLERRRPDDYRRREALEMTGKDGGPLEHREVSALPDYEREALGSAIRAHLRGTEEPERDPA
jgi:hypothetical protein